MDFGQLGREQRRPNAVDSERSHPTPHPDSFTALWAAHTPLTLSDLPLYEYACHEINRSMEFMLSGARAQEAGAD